MNLGKGEATCIPGRCPRRGPFAVNDMHAESTRKGGVGGRKADHPRADDEYIRSRDQCPSPRSDGNCPIFETERTAIQDPAAVVFPGPG